MLKKFAVFSAALLLAACGSGPVKVMDPLTTDEAPGKVRIGTIEVSYSELGREKINEDDAERIEDDDRYDNGEIKPTSLPLHELLKRALHKEFMDRGIAGDTPVNIFVSVDTMQYQNGIATILIGSSDQMSAAVNVKHAETDEVLADFYVDLIRGNAGLLGLAIRGAGIREDFSEDFAEYVADQLYGEE